MNKQYVCGCSLLYSIAKTASPVSLRCDPWARHIYPTLVLVQLRKTHPCLTERLLMGRKESNQTNKIAKTVIMSEAFSGDVSFGSTTYPVFICAFRTIFTKPSSIYINCAQMFAE